MPLPAFTDSADCLEQVDLYPSLAEIAGIPVDKTQESIAGTSWAALLDNPEAEHKEAAFAQYPRCWPANVSHDPSAFPNMARCAGVSKLAFAYMGFSIRTREYRYTEWAAWDGVRLAPLWNRSAGVEVSISQVCRQLRRAYVPTLAAAVAARPCRCHPVASFISAVYLLIHTYTRYELIHCYVAVVRPHCRPTILKLGEL